MALLVTSCTQDQPADPQVRAQRPTKKISTRFDESVWCETAVHSCGVQHPLEVDRTKTKALVTQLRQDKPSWLRYIKSVEVRGGPLDIEYVPELLVQTGIFVDQAGKDLGAVICGAMLEEKLDSAAIYGVSEDSQVLLAQCPIEPSEE
jgi:hypothetical protein